MVIKGSAEWLSKVRPRKIFCTPLSLTARFLLVASLVIILGMMVQGLWISSVIETRAKYHAGHAASLYIDNFVTRILPELEPEQVIPSDVELALDHLTEEAAAQMGVISVKIWSLTGLVVYSTEKTMTGRRFPPTPALLAAGRGKVYVEFEELTHEESDWERSQGFSLIEVYAPLRRRMNGGPGPVVGVVEFYEVADQLKLELVEAKRATWLVTGILSTVMIIALTGVVMRGGETIAEQRRSLAERVQQLSLLLDQNRDLQGRLARASRQAVEENEMFLRRLGADLHDGPAQLIGVALLRLDSLVPVAAAASGTSCDSSEVDTVRVILKDAMYDIRTLSEGLLMPQLETLTLAQTLASAVHDHERRTGTQVAFETRDLPESIPHFVKIGLFRFVQEGLSNAFRHADGKGQRVSAWGDGKTVFVQVEDKGPGMPVHPPSGDRIRLGLVGLSHRIVSLGGSMQVATEVGQGSRLTAAMPIDSR